MAAQSAVEVVGEKELRRAFREIGDKTSARQLKEAHKAAAEIVAKQARYEVPKRSGALGATIRAAGLQASAVVRAGTAKVPYAAPIHFGWARHHISPQPFLYKAADRRISEVVDEYERQIESIINTALGRQNVRV